MSRGTDIENERVIRRGCLYFLYVDRAISILFTGTIVETRNYRTERERRLKKKKNAVKRRKRVSVELVKLRRSLCFKKEIARRIIQKLSRLRDFGIISALAR